ncbi:MAG TPA: Maf family protein [Candidatus Acidoferrales bacterium]
MKLILASGSSRRAEILRNAGFSFTVQPAHIDETLLPNEHAADYVLRLAKAKAQLIAASATESAFIVGADTTVVCNGRIFGKPADPADAREMLRALSGATHEVLTGVAIIRASDRKNVAEVATTRVTFLPLSNEEIDAYIASGEPFDKAGAYGIQGLGGKFVSRIEGCYFNVMGLPLSRVWQALRSLGWHDNNHIE